VKNQRTLAYRGAERKGRGRDGIEMFLPLKRGEGRPEEVRGILLEGLKRG